MRVHLPEVAAVPFDDRDIEFSADDFERVRRLIRNKAGIDLQAGKQNMVYSRLARRLRDRGHRSFRSYLDALRGDTDPEWQEFINCLTTNLTAFFREAHHFETLAQELRARHGPIRIWSCAASTGEEPYSLAITAMECGAGHRTHIEASDVDTRVLAHAEAGIYSLESASGLGEDRLRRFFLRGSGRNAGFARVKPELRSLVRYFNLNLLSQPWKLQPHDMVFCRNVMIYFDRPTQRAVLERLHAVLKPGGLLFVGHSENFTEHRDLFTLSGKTVYRRAEAE